MVIQSTRFDPRERLRIMSRALKDLHRVLLEYQRREYEKHFGRIGSDFYVLQLAAEDAEFAWLRTLSQEMMRLDVAIAGKEPVSEAELRLAGGRLRYLLSPDASGTAFQSHYDRAMQTMPDIVMAHAQAIRSLPPAKELRLFRSDPPEDIRTYDAVPGFEARMHHPGEMLPGHGDHGYRALAVIAESSMAPGTVIPMHRHANEEIISWVPDGVMRHDDQQGNHFETDSGHLLVMKTGKGFEHAEKTLEGDPSLRMLQIFVRPSALQLEPGIQHAALPELKQGEWRLLIGPEDGSAPLNVRNRIEMVDIALDKSSSAPLPAREGWDTLLFVFDGEIDVDGVPFAASQSGLVLDPVVGSMKARDGSRVVAFLIDPTAKITRAGTIGR